MRRALARFLWWKMSFERLLEPRRTLTNPLLLDQLNRLDFGIHIDSRAQKVVHFETARKIEGA